MHCHGSKNVIGMAHKHATVVVRFHSPGSTSAGGCGHLLLYFSNRREPTHMHQHLRYEPKARERGEHYSSVAVVSTSDPGQHHGSPCRQTTINAVTPPSATLNAVTPPSATLNTVTPPSATLNAVTPPSATLNAVTPPSATLIAVTPSAFMRSDQCTCQKTLISTS